MASTQNSEDESLSLVSKFTYDVLRYGSALFSKENIK